MYGTRVNVEWLETVHTDGLHLRYVSEKTPVMYVPNEWKTKSRPLPSGKTLELLGVASDCNTQLLSITAMVVLA